MLFIQKNYNKSLLNVQRAFKDQTVTIIEYLTGTSKHDMLNIPNKVYKSKITIKAYVKEFKLSREQLLIGTEKIGDLICDIENIYLPDSIIKNNLSGLFLIKIEGVNYTITEVEERLKDSLTRLVLTEHKNEGFEPQKLEKNSSNPFF